MIFKKKSDLVLAYAGALDRNGQPTEENIAAPVRLPNPAMTLRGVADSRRLAFT
jgi:hypothetical protein